MQSAHACAVQTHFFVFALRQEKWSKKPPKMEPRGTPKHKKSRKTATQKNNKKQHCNKWVCGRILTSKRDYPFVPEVSPKSQKVQDTFKMGPQASKMSSRGSKITQNHESGRPKIKKIREKRPQEMSPRASQNNQKSGAPLLHCIIHITLSAALDTCSC